jgi:hypothetical protein
MVPQKATRRQGGLAPPTSPAAPAAGGVGWAPGSTGPHARCELRGGCDRRVAARVPWGFVRTSQKGSLGRSP